MASEIVQNKDTYPVINPPAIKSAAAGYENIAKTFGMIAERSAAKATEYASEASKANLLQTHALLQDVEAQSKIEMLKSPGHSEAIAKNAEQTATKIQQDAKLNRGDKLSLKDMAHSTILGLKLSAAEKTIGLAKQAAKDNFLTAQGDTLQSIRNDVHVNPEKADALINAQYEAIHGAVRSGIITAHEASVLHKELVTELNMAHELVLGMKDGLLNASDINAYHASAPGNVPMSNAALPINQETAMNAEHHYGSLQLNDLRSISDNGNRPTSAQLVSLKTIDKVDAYYNYLAGGIKATGDITSTKSWIELTNKLDTLTNSGTLSTFEEGYKNRLKKFITTAQQPGHYQNFVASTPEGARMYQAFAQNEAAINKEVITGDDAATAHKRYIKHNDNLNDLVTKADALGIGMHYPDYLRQPIPGQMLSVIQGGFDKGGDINGAINNIQTLNPKNRVYAMNVFHDNPRKAVTVMEVGYLEGKATPGFLGDLFASQQVDALGSNGKTKDSQDKFMQLDQGKTGYSDKKLADSIKPMLTSITSYLNAQPQGEKVVSGKIDQAVRYLKFTAAQHNDFEFKHLNEYMATYTNNMNAAYGVKTGFNFVVDTNNVPLEENQIQVLASHAINNEVRKSLLEYKSESEVNRIFSNYPPQMVSSPGGRIEVVYPNGEAVADKYGHPAYSKIFTESVWHRAEADIEAQPVGGKVNIPLHVRGFNIAPEKKVYIRGNQDIIRPIKEGNIDLENRQKVWDKKGNYETVKTITREFDGKTVLLPTIINGKEVSVKEATEHYKKTGEHLGIFENRQDADKYDKQMHERHGWIGKSNKWEGD
ncbi:MAG TPA: hypothetical protein VNU45_17910 [Rummeliibacillus sp.]|nr:hypothetical protein [Rummeliibacillus sp.]